MRDKIVALLEAEGGVVNYEVISGEELITALIAKFEEELKVLKAARTKRLDPGPELVDLIEIAKSINQLLWHSAIQTEVSRSKKESRVGGFVAGHFVHTVMLPKDNEWAVKFAADVERFPQITG